MLIRWKTKDKDKEKCDKTSGQKSSSAGGGSKKKRKFGRDGGSNFCCMVFAWVAETMYQIIKRTV